MKAPFESPFVSVSSGLAVAIGIVGSALSCGALGTAATAFAANGAPVAGAVASSPQAESIGTVIEASGDAFADSARGRRPLRKDAPLYAGERIETSPGGRVRVRIGSWLAMQLAPKSKIRLERSGDGWLCTLESGALLSRVRHATEPVKASRFRVRTSTATLGVRGTTFFTAVSGARTFFCDCTGEVSLEWSKGNETFRTRHHDSPVWVGESTRVAATSADGIPHSDADIAELGRIVGEK